MIDRYTKVCLTVIAVSLAVIGLRGLPMVDPAWAAGGVQKIAICEMDGDVCATIKTSYSRTGANARQKAIGSGWLMVGRPGVMK